MERLWKNDSVQFYIQRLGHSGRKLHSVKCQLCLALPWHGQTDLCRGTPQKHIIEIKDTENCLAHALIIEIARIDNDSNYESYRKFWKIRSVVRDMLGDTSIDLSSDEDIPEIARFQEHFREYKIVVFQSLSCDNICLKVESSPPIVWTYFTTMLKGPITWLRIWRALWLEGTSVKRVTKVVRGTWRTYATRRVVSALRICRYSHSLRRMQPAL